MDKTKHTDNKHRIIKGFFQTHPPAPLTFERGACSGVGLADVSRQKRGVMG